MIRIILLTAALIALLSLAGCGGTASPTAPAPADDAPPPAGAENESEVTRHDFESGSLEAEGFTVEDGDEAEGEEGGGDQEGEGEGQ